MDNDDQTDWNYCNTSIPMINLEGLNRIIVFRINGQRFGILLSETIKIIRAVEITMVPNGPGYLCGIIDMYGDIVPVINMHVRIGLSDRPTRVEDRFIIANVNKRVLALRVDEVTEIIENADNLFLNVEAISSDLEIHGVIKSEDGLILIYNLETFLSTEDFDFLYDLSKNGTTNITDNKGHEDNKNESLSFWGMG